MLRYLLILAALTQAARAAEPDLEADPLVEVFRDEMERRANDLSIHRWNPRNLAEHIFRVQLECVELAIELSPSQRTKLETAGRGDLLAALETPRLEFEERLRSANPLQTDLKPLFQHYLELRSGERAALRGASLFEKTLSSTLTREQIASLDEALGDARRMRRLHWMLQTVLAFDARLPLTRDDRQKLRLLIKGKTPLPARDASIGQIDRQFIEAFGRVTEAEAKPILEDLDWLAARRFLARLQHRMEFALEPEEK